MSEHPAADEVERLRERLSKAEAVIAAFDVDEALGDLWGIHSEFCGGSCDCPARADRIAAALAAWRAAP